MGEREAYHFGDSTTCSTSSVINTSSTTLDTTTWITYRKEKPDVKILDLIKQFDKLKNCDVR